MRDDTICLFSPASVIGVMTNSDCCREIIDSGNKPRRRLTSMSAPTVSIWSRRCTGDAISISGRKCRLRRKPTHKANLETNTEAKGTQPVFGNRLYAASRGGSLTLNLVRGDWGKMAEAEERQTARSGISAYHIGQRKQNCRRRACRPNSF